MRKFRIDLYQIEVYLTKFDFEVETEVGEKPDGDGGVYHGEGEDEGYFMIFVENPDDYDLVAHEAYHAASRISDYLGMVATPNTSNEHIAYLVGFIAGKIHELLK